MLVTGKFRAGKFDHKLPKELADLLEDLAKLLRSHGSSAIHQARLGSTPSENPEQDGVSRPKHAHDLAWLTHHMNGTYRNSLALFQWLQTLTAHAEGVEDYEESRCVSCKRDADHFEPVEPGHATYCWWCRRFRDNYGTMPPLAVLAARHRGLRITTALIKEHMPKGPTR